ncbi:hypothetical protein BKA61DRAFT_313566 [Leptodontidium sp. MPI-SDFR-AT-0119]|nr:hypothetical protein BKA61DRAFT_313566 [Leptodontidium sp. MPI-SDFR-AT-0119]
MIRQHLVIQILRALALLCSLGIWLHNQQCFYARFDPFDDTHTRVQLHPNARMPGPTREFGSLVHRCGGRCDRFSPDIPFLASSRRSGLLVREVPHPNDHLVNRGGSSERVKVEGVAVG